MSEETRQDLSRMEQSAVASSSALVSSSESAPTSASFSSSPGKETQLVLSSSTSIGASRLSPQPPPSPSKAPANGTTAYKQSSPSSFHPSPSSSLQKNVSGCSPNIVASFSSNASAVNSGSSAIIGEVAAEAQIKSTHEIDKNSNGCHRTMNNSQSSVTTLSTANLSLPAVNVSTMETPITTESIQIPPSSQTSVVAMTGSVNGCNDSNITNNTSSQQNNMLVQHQQQFQQAVTAGMAQQTSGCFNVQMNSDPGHGSLQQTTTMQGVLQQTVVVSDNVAVQQRVAVAQETVSQQIVHPVSTATAVAQVAGVEQQQQAAAQPQQQQQQTASFQLHQPVGNALATQPTFQLANLGQSLIAPQNFQSLVAQPGTIFNGTQIFCTPDLTRTQQIDVPSMGCQQFLAPTNTFTGGHMVSGVPQVQLVQTGPNQFIQQQCLQQQFMFQSMPGLQNNGVTIQQQHQTTQQQQQQASITNFQQQQQTQQQTQQAEGSTKTQTILPATSSQQQPQQNLSCMQQTQQQNTPHQNMSMIRLAVSGSYTIPQQNQQPQALSVKGLATVLPQQTNMNICNNNNINQKQLLQKQPQQPLLFGTIGMLQNQTIQQQPQQPTLYQQQRPLNLGSMGPAAQFTIGNNGALRFAHAPSFITNTGQLLSTNQTVLNLGQIQVPLMNQQLLVTPQGGGTTTLLGSQPLYIRTADAFSTQQGVVGNVQQLQPIQQVKNIANIAPQTAAVINQVNPQPRRDKNGGGSSGSQQNVGKSGHKSGSGKLQSIAKSSSLTSASVSSSATVSTVASTSNNQLQQNAVLNSMQGMTTTASALQNNSFVPPSPSSAVGKLNQSSAALPSDRSPSVRVQDEPAASRPHPAVIVVQPKQQQPFEEKRQVEKMEVDGNASCANGKQHQEKDKSFAPFSPQNPSAQGNLPIEECSEEGRNGIAQQVTLPMKEEDQDEQRLVIVEEPSDRSSAKTFGKSEKKKRKRTSKPKVLTHIIEGFIIQEATEPFPVNRTPVSNQFLSSSLKSSSLESLIKDSATSNRSGNGLEDSSTEEEDNNNNDDDDETEDESVPSKKIKLGDQEVKQGPGDHGIPANASNNNNIQPSILVQTSHEVPVNINQQVQLAPMNLSASHPPRQHVATNVKHVLPPQTTTSGQQRLAPLNKAQDRSSATHLICEFCGEMGLAETFPCSKRFCSVSCSKRFSAHSNKFKQAAEHGHGSSGTDAKQMSMMSVIKGSKRPLGQTKNHQQGTTTDRGPTTATVAASIHIPASVAPSIPVGNNNMLLTASNLQQFDHNLQQPQQQQPQQHLPYSMPTTAVTPNKQNQLQNPGTTSPGTKQQPGNAAGDDLAGVHCPDKPLSQWSVNDVYDFVASLPGCGTYAQEFRQQEIDGSALGLLKEDHLMTTLNVKLGPALKICAVVNSLKTE